MHTSAFQNTRCASWQTPKHLEISTNDLYKVNDQTLEKIELKGCIKFGFTTHVGISLCYLISCNAKTFLNIFSNYSYELGHFFIFALYILLESKNMNSISNLISYNK